MAHMLNMLRGLWELGSDNRSSMIKRQVELSNQMALFGLVATLPYQVFYALADFSVYRPVFLFNLVFMVGYLLVVVANRQRLPGVARNLLLSNGAVQILVVTSLIGAGAGVHLFVFTLGSVTVFLFHRISKVQYLLLVSVLITVFLVCQFSFPHGSTPVVVPAPWLDWMYAASAIGSMAMAAVVLYLFRQAIVRAESDLLVINQRLEILSGTDELTGLANRRELDETLKAAWTQLDRHRVSLSVLVCDVDYFKRFNDRFGHSVGDRCLQRVAGALKGVCGRPGDFVARYGGEEFVVVLSGCDHEGTVVVAERLRLAVESLAIPHPDAGEKGVVTISVGGATSGAAGASADELFEQADSALYRAKAQGRNRVVVESR